MLDGPEISRTTDNQKILFARKDLSISRIVISSADCAFMTIELSQKLKMFTANVV